MVRKLGGTDDVPTLPFNRHPPLAQHLIPSYPHPMTTTGTTREFLKRFMAGALSVMLFIAGVSACGTLGARAAFVDESLGFAHVGTIAVAFHDVAGDSDAFAIVPNARVGDGIDPPSGRADGSDRGIGGAGTGENSDLVGDGQSFAGHGGILANEDGSLPTTMFLKELQLQFLLDPTDRYQTGLGN